MDPDPCVFWPPGSGSGSLVRGTDPRIRIRTKMSRIRNTARKTRFSYRAVCLRVLMIAGHIHELQIHVPWTRLQSEPIVLTINTIECVLSLPDNRSIRSGVFANSVADPDPHVFGPPGSRSGSISQRYGSGSGSFYH